MKLIQCLINMNDLMFFFILSDLNMFRNPLNEKLCLPPQRFDNGPLHQEQGQAENANSGIQQQEALGG